MDAAPLLAHQGGWDEILLVVGPLAVVAGLLWVANKRVTAQLAETEAEGNGGVEGSSGTEQRP
jgi:cyanate permease